MFWFAAGITLFFNFSALDWKCFNNGPYRQDWPNSYIKHAWQQPRNIRPQGHTMRLNKYRSHLLLINVWYLYAIKNEKKKLNFDETPCRRFVKYEISVMLCSWKMRLPTNIFSVIRPKQFCAPYTIVRNIPIYASNCPLDHIRPLL